MRHAIAAAAILLCSAVVGIVHTPATVLRRIPDDAAIRRILIDRVDVRRQGTGIVVGLIDSDGRRHVVAQGRRGGGDPAPVDGDTVFEIGSLTKLFTTLLLADMAVKGEVSLDDPVADYLPPGVTLPERGGLRIALADLATHSSGLPRLPGNLAPRDQDNPYADYSVERLYRFLAGYSLPHNIGSHYEYSNVGGALLGVALARRAGADFETLLRRRITGPLGMTSTAIALTPAMRAHMAAGHDAWLKPAKNWDMPALAAAAGLRSTANDLLTFAAAELDGDGALGPAMARQLSVRRRTSAPDITVALGWHVLSDPRGAVIQHDGGTGGYRAFIAIQPATHQAVVVLANAATPAGVADIGLHLLLGRKLADPVPPQPHALIARDHSDDPAPAIALGGGG